MKKCVGLIMAALLMLLSIPFGAISASADITHIGEVDVTVTAPDAGTTGADIGPYDYAATPPGCSYTITGAEWMEAAFENPENPEESIYQPFTGTFEAGETYYLWLELLADEDCCFNQGGPYGYTTVTVNGGTPLYEFLSVTNSVDEHNNYKSSGTVMIAVTLSAEDEPVPAFFGVLISDTDGGVNTGGGYLMAYIGTEFGDGVLTHATNNFVSEGAEVTLTAVPDEGYHFVGWYQGEPDPAAGEPPFTGDPISTYKSYSFTAPISLERPYLCAVFAEGAEEKRDAYQLSVWVGHIDGNTAFPDAGGQVAIRYTPSEPNVYDMKVQDGTGFGYLALAGCYVGDEITVLAQPNEGYRFVGWYRVNIDYNESGADTDMAGVSPNKAYLGEVISTAKSYTYKPCVTVLPGDTEPLRYVCAVFEEGEDTALLGDANRDGSVDMKDVLTMRKYIAHLTDDIDLAAADVNGDGSVDMKDVLLVRKFIARLIESL
ncbi:MAG: dockerin type I repeat-containing protein [Clostridia bacterium]|nr:dockerin type I repeat-containing protein [Clostridia bacterium]